MYAALLRAALFVSTLAASELSAEEVDRRVDKIIEITRKDDKLVFIERGKDKLAPVTIVVGQKIRWENKDTRPHALVTPSRSKESRFLTPRSSSPGTTRTCSLTSTCIGVQVANRRT